MANLRTGLALLAALSLVPAAAAAPQQSQSSAPQEKEKPKPKAKRVWSEDDVKELRKPWDEYEDAKRAAAEKAAAAKDKEKGAPAEPSAAAGEKPAGEPSGAPENDLPKTLEEAEQQLDAKFSEVRAQQQVLAGLQRELYADNITDQNRADLRAKIEKARTKLLEAQLEHKKLVELRDEMKAKQEGKGGETKPPAPQAPPPAL
jgi:hypothetical protein